MVTLSSSFNELLFALTKSFIGFKVKFLISILPERLFTKTANILDHLLIRQARCRLGINF